MKKHDTYDALPALSTPNFCCIESLIPRVQDLGVEGLQVVWWVAVPGLDAWGFGGCVKRWDTTARL